MPVEKSGPYDRVGDGVYVDGCGRAVYDADDPQDAIVVRDLLNAAHAAGVAAERERARGLVVALRKIADGYHADRSCSLEAQGYSEAECARIVAEDAAAVIARDSLTAWEAP